MVKLLISSVNVNPDELINKMNINTDAVLVNQCSENKEEQIGKGSFNVYVYHRDERGVGKSRNLCIDKSLELFKDEDILLFSDEDIIYKDDYALVVENAFKKHKEAEMLLFNVKVAKERRTYWNTEYKKVGRFNSGRYPAYSIAVKCSVLKNSKVRFSLLFGGGAKYSNGEDSLFLMNCAKKKIKMFMTEDVIGEEKYRESTWFKGFTEKFFFDRGVLFYFLYGRLALIWALRFVLVKKEMFEGEIKRKQGFKLLIKGIQRGKKEYKIEKHKK